MIKSLTVTNYLGESLKLELTCPEKSGFAVKNIDGIGPGKADIHVTEMATGDGSIYNSSRLNTRNIVLSLKLLEKPTIEAMRHESYKYFPIKTQVTLLFETDNRKCQIIGQVESNESTIFSDDEIAQISIICPDPYFYSVDETLTIFSGIDSQFEFEFENEYGFDPMILGLTTQSGTGDPSLTNIRPISGLEKTTINGIEYTLPQKLYNTDKFDIGNKTVQALMSLITVTGNENGWLYNSASTGDNLSVSCPFPSIKDGWTSMTSVSNYFQSSTSLGQGWYGKPGYIQIGAPGTVYFGFSLSLLGVSQAASSADKLAAAKTWIKAKNTNGVPVQILAPSATSNTYKSDTTPAFQNTDQIEFGDIKTDTSKNIVYTGDSEVGVIITIHATGAVGNITICNTATREALRVSSDMLSAITGSGIIAGDDIIISTIKRHKSIILLRSGVYSNILNCVDRYSNWFQLTKNDNIFTYIADYGVTNLVVSIVNQIVYEGV